MEEYKFGGGEDLYYLTMDDWERKVIHTYSKEGVDRSHLCSALLPNLPDGYSMEIHPHGEWIPWSGGGCPVTKGVMVDVKFAKQESKLNREAGDWNWNIPKVSGKGGRITHYRLHVEDVVPPTIKPTEGKWNVGDLVRGNPEYDDYVDPLWISDPISDRQTARTTKQIKNTPKGSVLINLASSNEYVARLCVKLGRADLRLETPRWLDSRFYGYDRGTVVIIGHAVELTPKQSENLKRFVKPVVGKHDDYIEPLSSAYDAWIKGGKEIKTRFSVDNGTDSGNMDTQFKQQEEIQMTTRNLMTATLVDNDKGLEIDQSLVYSTEVMVGGSDTQTAIQELIFTDTVLGERIAEHNKKRTKTVNLEVLERTGQEVFLRPKKISELTWSVK